MTDILDFAGVMRRNRMHLRIVKSDVRRRMHLSDIVCAQSEIDKHRNNYVRMALDHAGEPIAAEKLYLEVLALREAADMIERRSDAMANQKPEGTK